MDQAYPVEVPVGCRILLRFSYFAPGSRGSSHFIPSPISETVRPVHPESQVVAVNTAMSSLVKTLNVFPRERTIVTRERAKKAYHILPYFCSKCAQHCGL